MPLMKYFGFVGSALVLLLLAMNWVLPEPAAEPVLGSIERPVIRINSIEKLPEGVVFDTSMPHIAPPPSVMRGAAQPLQSAFTFAQMTPGSSPAFFPLAEVAPKRPNAAKRKPETKAATHRVVPQTHIAAVKNYPVREEAALSEKPPAKTTFLDEIAGRLGQVFKLN